MCVGLGNMTAEKPIPNWKFDTSNIEQSHRFEAWADSVSGYGDHKEVENSRISPTWESEFWLLDSLILTDNRLGAFQANRGPGVIRQAGMEHVLIRLIVSGAQNAIFGEQSTRMRPGEVHIFDLNTPYYGETLDHLSSLVAILPYKAIGYDPSRHPGHIRFAADSLVCRMITNALTFLRDRAPMSDASEGSLLARGLSGLVRGVILPSESDLEAAVQTDKARLNILKQYIEQNLHDPELDISKLCKTFNASRANIYRLFADDQGVASYINERRLVHAFTKIREEYPERGKVKQIAERYGFTDQGHFSRVLKKKFKISPSDAMGIWPALDHEIRSLKIDNTPSSLIAAHG